MKKLILLLTVIFAAGSMCFANSAYTVDDNAIDAAFERSEELSLDDLLMESYSIESSYLDLSNVKGVNDDMSAVLAAALAFVPAVLFGVAGVHRLYLEGGCGVFAGYFCTWGGFGCLTVIDTYILLVKAPRDGLGPYIGCSRFFMWTCD